MKNNAAHILLFVGLLVTLPSLLRGICVAQPTYPIRYAAFSVLYKGELLRFYSFRNGRALASDLRIFDLWQGGNPVGVAYETPQVSVIVSFQDAVNSPLAEKRPGGEFLSGYAQQVREEVALADEYFIIPFVWNDMREYPAVKIADARDTMVIRLHNAPEWANTRIDSIPFLPGSYDIDVLQQVWRRTRELPPDKRMEKNEALNITPLRWSDHQRSVFSRLDRSAVFDSLQLSDDGNEVIAIGNSPSSATLYAVTAPNNLHSINGRAVITESVSREKEEGFRGRIEFIRPMTTLGYDADGFPLVVDPLSYSVNRVGRDGAWRGSRELIGIGQDLTVREFRASPVDAHFHRLEDRLPLPTYFPGEKIGFMRSGSSRVMTTDGGESWVRPPGLPDGYDFGTVNRFFFPSAGEWFGVTSQGGFLHFTSPGGPEGPEWEWEIPVPFWPKSLTGIDFDADGNGAIVGEGGAVFVTRDSGMSWRYRPVPEGYDLTCVLILKPDTLLAGDRSGRLLWIRLPD